MTQTLTKRLKSTPTEISPIFVVTLRRRKGSRTESETSESDLEGREVREVPFQVSHAASLFVIGQKRLMLDESLPRKDTDFGARKSLQNPGRTLPYRVLSVFRKFRRVRPRPRTGPSTCSTTIHDASAPEPQMQKRDILENVATCSILNEENSRSGGGWSRRKKARKKSFCSVACSCRSTRCCDKLISFTAAAPLGGCFRPQAPPSCRRRHSED